MNTSSIPNCTKEEADSAITAALHRLCEQAGLPTGTPGAGFVTPAIEASKVELVGLARHLSENGMWAAAAEVELSGGRTVYAFAYTGPDDLMKQVGAQLAEVAMMQQASMRRAVGDA